MKKILFLIPGVFLAVILLMRMSQLEKSASLHLWYKQSATTWAEALPVGNGRLGAMVFGDPEMERLQLNEESLWAGSKIENNNPDALKYLPEIREALFNGKYSKAWKLSEKYLLGTPPRIRSYEPLGDLTIDYQWNSELKEYRRGLDLRTGIAFTEFDVGNNHIYEEVFASAPEDVIVVSVRATEPFSAAIRLDRLKDAKVIYDYKGFISMEGQIVDQDDPLAGEGGKHMRFATLCMIGHKDGKVLVNAESLLLQDVREATIYITGATDYQLDKLDTDVTIDPMQKCKQIFERSGKLEKEEIKNRHLEEFTAIFDRVDLRFEKDTLADLPTDVRLKRVQEGHFDNGLAALYFQYGRYLLMSSSRKPGRLPANLQGIWNKEFKAPWNADFHTNINLQMNYWPAEVCNLPECTEVLTGFMEKLTAPGSITAKKMYGTRGWTLHHLTDPFGRTGVADGVWGVTPLNGPWMTFPLYRHYEFTHDLDYLESIYPVLKGSARFVLDFLVKSPEGYMVTNPSHSPENNFFIPGSAKKSMLCYGATVDVQIINQLFDNCIEAAELLAIDAGFTDTLKAVMKQLPPLQIGADGTIQEWLQDYKEAEPGHRHMSHLLALYPLAQITPASPELYEAARKTIERRLANGGGHTGWSRAWIVNFFARMQNGDKALWHLQKLFEKSTLPNLFDTHPPFQIDGNFGATAGIAEMLLQSHGGVIHLLPALPKAWPEGKVTGLKARGNFTVDIEWKEGRLVHANVSSEVGGNIVVKYDNMELTANVQPGGSYLVDF